MKKRNTTIFAFLLLAAVGMGVGYAALTDTLSLSATVSGTGVNDNDITDSKIFDIVWTAREPEETQVSAETRPTLLGTASLDQSDSDIATISVEGMLLKGDKVVFVFDIKVSFNSTSLP